MLENEPPRLTLENQPSNEGPYREIGELHRKDDEICGFEILEDFERFNQAIETGAETVATGCSFCTIVLLHCRMSVLMLWRLISYILTKEAK